MQASRPSSHLILLCLMGRLIGPVISSLHLDLDHSTESSRQVQHDILGAGAYASGFIDSSLLWKLLQRDHIYVHSELPLIFSKSTKIFYNIPIHTYSPRSRNSHVLPTFGFQEMNCASLMSAAVAIKPH